MKQKKIPQRYFVEEFLEKKDFLLFLDLFSTDNPPSDLDFEFKIISDIFNGMCLIPAGLLLGSLYEHYLGFIDNKNHRKTQGIFYTPLEIVEFILDKTLLIKLNELSPKTINFSILDPACGIGIFLIAAFQRLAAYLDFRTISRETLKKTLQQFYGLDLDPLAVKICKMWFLCELSQYIDPKDLKTSLKEFIPALGNIRTGNALTSNLRQTLTLKANEGFKIILGNPPFLAVKRGHFKYQKKFLQESFSLARGQFDAYELFVERATQIIAENGFLGLVLPRRFLTNEKNELLRRFLLNNYKIYTLAEVGAPFQASVEAAILIAIKVQKQTDQLIQLKDNRQVELISVSEFKKTRKTRSVPQNLLKKLPFSIFNVNLDEELYALICKISAQSKPLKEWGVNI
ncbi:MAG: class I SAM-dependent DNA methyltransferase, partial [Candidatus Hodarchaeota archaeon]